MTTVGITGHISLSPSTRSAVAAEVTARLAAVGTPITGYSALAPGADQVFAWSVAAVGGDIVFVSACATFATTIPDENRHAFDAVRTLAVDAVEMPHELPTDQAYFDAGAYIADTVDVLIAVWDGEPARGFGGTADIVARRRELGRELIIVWPDGASRK